MFKSPSPFLAAASDFAKRVDALPVDLVKRNPCHLTADTIRPATTKAA